MRETRRTDARQDHELPECPAAASPLQRSGVLRTPCLTTPWPKECEPWGGTNVSLDRSLSIDPTKNLAIDFAIGLTSGHGTPTRP
eukprot:5576243-Pyramimonas_sp.AAC.1